MVDRVKIASYFQCVADWLSRTAAPRPDAAEEEKPVPLTQKDLMDGLVRYADGSFSTVNAAIRLVEPENGSVPLPRVVEAIDDLLHRPRYSRIENYDPSQEQGSSRVPEPQR